MKTEERLDAMAYLEPRLILEGNDPELIKKHSVIWMLGLAACLAVIVLLAIPHRQAEPPMEEQTALAAPAVVETQQSPATEKTGLYIPAQELPEPAEGVECDMIGALVYEGHVYTEAETYYGEEAEKIDGLMEEKLGHAAGTLNEWSEDADYAVEFASTMDGEVYTVRGYDREFRLCVRRLGEDAQGAPLLILQFLERLNGITLTEGADLFEARLHLLSRTGEVAYQSHADWNEAKMQIKPISFPSGVLETFLEQLGQKEFVYTWDETQGVNQHFYDNPNQVHLYFTLTDGTRVELRLIEGGYVGYQALGWYFVQMPGEAFDRLYAACME